MRPCPTFNESLFFLLTLLVSLPEGRIEAASLDPKGKKAALVLTTAPFRT